MHMVIVQGAQEESWVLLPNINGYSLAFVPTHFLYAHKNGCSLLNSSAGAQVAY